MPAINEPFNIINGQPLDADQVMANFGAIVSVVNGSLEMGANVLAAAPTSAITGKDSSEGVSASAMRSDAQFVIQGVENAASDPATGNRVGRDYYNTVTNQRRLCINAAGSGTWVSMGNPLASELVLHAAQHSDGAADQLADTSIAERSMKARTVAVSEIGADSSTISTSTFTTITTLSVTTTGIQTLAITMRLNFKNSHATNKPSVFWRLRDTTASNVTIFKSNFHQLGIQGGGSDAADLSGTFYYTVPATGARTLTLQAGSDVGTVVVRAASTVGTDATAAVNPQISAVIL